MSENNRETDRVNAPGEDNGSVKKERTGEAAGDVMGILQAGVLMDRMSVEVGAFIYRYMHVNRVPPSLMDYVLAGISCRMKDMKTEEYVLSRGKEGDE